MTVAQQEIQKSGKKIFGTEILVPKTIWSSIKNTVCTASANMVTSIGSKNLFTLYCPCIFPTKKAKTINIRLWSPSGESDKKSKISPEKKPVRIPTSEPL